MSDWAARTASVNPGDRVAYARHWLRSIGQLTGDVPQARGTVTRIEPVGTTRLAVITWDQPDLPERVNVKNLSPVRDGAVMD